MNKQLLSNTVTALIVASVLCSSLGLLGGCGGGSQLSPVPAAAELAPGQDGAGVDAAAGETTPQDGAASKRPVAWVDDKVGTATADSDGELGRSASLAGFYMYFSDDINSSASNWRVSNGGGSGRFVVGTRFYANPSYALYMQPYYNYENDFVRSLNIPVYPADPGGVLHLQFATRHGLEAGRDKVFVEVSTNGGASFSLVKTLSGRNGYWPGFTKWTVTLPGNFSTNVKYYQVRFRLQSDYSITDWGFAFDRIRVYEARGFYVL